MRASATRDFLLPLLESHIGHFAILSPAKFLAEKLNYCVLTSQISGIIKGSGFCIFCKSVTLCAVRWICLVCARHGHDLMGCKSPVDYLESILYDYIKKY